MLALLSSTAFVSSGGYLAIFLLSVAQSCCIPTSSELTLGFAGVLAATGKMSLPGAIAVGATGELVGAYIAWWIGRSAGRTIVDRYGKYVLLTHHDLDRAEAWYARHDRWGVLGGRLVPLIRNFVALPAGVAEVPALPFGILTAIGSLIWDGAMAGIGYGIGTRWRAIVHVFSDAGYVVGALAVVALFLLFLHRWRSYQLQLATGGASLAAGATTAPGASVTSAAAPVVPGDDLVALVRRLAAPGAAGATESRGVAINERVTAGAAAVLFVLLAAEGVTIVTIHHFLTLHVVIGLVLIPPIVVKLASTTWRFLRYYTGHPDYVAKGPPVMLLRVLAPLLVVTTVMLFASGIALVAVHRPAGWIYVVHRYGFVLWFVILAVHVLAYVWRVPGLLRPDFRRARGRHAARPPARWARLGLLALSIVGGIVLGVELWPVISGNVHGFLFK
jgi:membrane protein DedA with SNARE-associated domain